MNRERYVAVKALLADLMDLDPSKRTAALKQIDDSALRKEVESLLMAHDKAEEDAFIEPSQEDREGQHLGPYRVVRQVGQGATGAVYLAVRDDDEFKKRVAIKIVHRGLFPEEVFRRFRQERQILAGIDHENIAKLLDGGTTEDGCPYLVMEYIEGLPITEFCDRDRLSIRQRLELFRTVCSAVQHAHQNLVVHRDLKPGNIFVTNGGVPKLLDFGIAKFLNPELAASPDAPTRFDVRIMTPEYASPEQACGGSIGTATDIYSLGVLLCELLTGHRPYSVEGRPLHEVVQVISEAEPTRPSAFFSRGGAALASASSLAPSADPSRDRGSQPDKLRRRLRGDLDRIVLMALRKEPRRRYSSAEQLSEDIHRHLVGLPVIAARDSTTYRMGKFVRRHRVGVSFAATVLILLVGIAASMKLQADRIARGAETSRQVSEFLVKMFESSDPYSGGGELVTAREILDRGSQRIYDELRDQPLVQATLLTTIGEVYSKLGMASRGRELLENGLSIRENVLGRDHPDVASTLVALAKAHFELDHFVEADSLYHRALAIRERAFGRSSLEVAGVLYPLADLYRDLARFDDAESLLNRTLAIHEARQGKGSLPVAETLKLFGYVYKDQGRLDLAESFLRRDLGIRTQLLSPDDPRHARSLELLGIVHAMQRHFSKAEPLFKRALDLRVQSLPRGHTMLGFSYYNLGCFYLDQDKYDEAELALEQSKSIWSQADGDIHTNISYSLHDLGRLHRKQERYAEAETDYRQALKILEENWPQDHPRVVGSKLALANLYRDWGRPEQAKALYTHLLEILDTDSEEFAQVKSDYEKAEW